MLRRWFDPARYRATDRAMHARQIAEVDALEAHPRLRAWYDRGYFIAVGGMAAFILSFATAIATGVANVRTPIPTAPLLLMALGLLSIGVIVLCVAQRRAFKAAAGGGA